MSRILLLSLIATSAILAEMDFDSIEVFANELKNGEKSFLKPGAITSKSELNSQNQSIDSIVRSLAGSYTQIDQAQGSVSVNIRGLTGLGRVNTMIDGVTQTYYGTSSDSKGFHDFTGNLGTSAFGAILDQNFLASVDIERGSFSGANNAIMGSANFRTIGVDDVIRNGDNLGFLGRYSYGTNGIGPSYMGAIATKIKLENGSNIGVLYGYSGKKITQDYKDGSGKRAKDATFDINGDGQGDLGRAIDVENLTQKPKNHLLKFEYSNEDHAAILSYKNHSNYLAKRKIDSNSYQLDYHFDPDSDFLNLALLASHTNTKQKYDKIATLSWVSLKQGMQFQNKATNFDLSNTFKFNLDNAKISSKFGLNLLNNDYIRKTSDKDFATLTTNYAVPQGKQKIRTIYLDNSLEYSILKLDANVNFMHWQISGTKGKCEMANTLCEPKEPGKIKKNSDAINYSLMLGVNLHEYFSPFVSYAKSTRALNVQEFFHSGTVYEDINTFLKPETAKTAQIGFNLHKNGIFANSDVIGFKATYYHTKIKNFIYDRLITKEALFLSRLNGNAKFRGLEIELMYDADYFYTSANYARQKANYPLSDSMALDWTNGPSSGVSQFSQLPKYYATIDTGVRLFGNKLTFGSITKITGKAKRFNPLFEYASNETEFKRVKTQDLPKIPTVFDF
ncbi:putative TonB-dependent receptor [Campylobacter majalis]|uniref:TonB-dependent receptor n=1 Tax=Campylobacter majalis TaxID=2790656 RepID=A0ABM8Q7J2_9BACT|nr:TonB-dependent receptor [Campylobacter majalis]CAD7288920.1 putative TonB-dependent receptor [Campylobacter majalis]